MIKGAAQAEIALRDGKLMAKGGFYGREIPLPSVVVPEARRLVLGKGEPRACVGAPMAWACPAWPPGGTNCAMVKRLGVRHGQVQGRLCADPAGYAVIVSPAEPDGFLDALRRASAAPSSSSGRGQTAPAGPAQ
jgi:hypothetical protein